MNYLLVPRRGQTGQLQERATVEACRIYACWRSGGLARRRSCPQHVAVRVYPLGYLVSQSSPWALNELGTSEVCGASELL